MNRATRHAPKSALPPLTRDEVRTFVLVTRARMAAFDFWVAAWRLRLALRTWDPNQPRVPAGNPDGGQWMGEGGPAAKPAEPRVREAQLSPRRGSRPYPTVRINGRDEIMTEGEEAEMVGWRINRAAALAEVWKRDPSWRPPANLYATPRGVITALENDTSAAEERLRELDLEEGASSSFVYRDGTGRRNDAPICRPNGNWVGDESGRSDVRLLSPSDFKSTWQELSAGSTLLLPHLRYEGNRYETKDGGLFGLRNSRDSGWTIDLMGGGFFRSPRERMRFHNYRNIEGKVMSRRLELEVRGYVFDIDDKPMWDFQGAALRLTDDPVEQRAFVRECVLRMLEIGAVPYEVAHGEPWARSTKRWEGMSPDAIADDVVAATFAIDDVYEANIWWMDGHWWNSLDHEAAARLPRPRR